jgi:hypothetical protein
MEEALLHLGEAFAELKHKAELQRREIERLHDLMLMRWRPPRSAPRDETPVLMDAIISPVLHDARMPRVNIPGRIVGAYLSGAWRNPYTQNLLLVPRAWMPLPPQLPGCGTCIHEDECDYSPREPA